MAVQLEQRLIGQVLDARHELDPLADGKDGKDVVGHAAGIGVGRNCGCRMVSALISTAGRRAYVERFVLPAEEITWLENTLSWSERWEYTESAWS